MADDESNQRRKVKFLQILLLMDSFEAEDVLRSHERVIWTRSWIRRREERGAYHQLIRELAVEDAPDVLLVQMCRLERLHCQFESTSNCCNVLPQQNVALKIAVKNRPV